MNTANSQSIESDSKKSERIKLIDRVYLNICRDLRNKSHLVLTNVYMWHWEFDILSVTSSDYLYEYEVKVCKYDFQADFNKHRKHDLYKKQFADKSLNLMAPNYFYYVMPEELADELKKDIPEYAGLITTCHLKPIIIKAPKLKTKKISEFNYKTLFKKMYFQNIDLKNKFLRIRSDFESNDFHQMSFDDIKKNYNLPFY